MADLTLENLDHWLVNGKVCHLNIQAVEMNSLDGIVDISGQFSFTDPLNAFGFRQSTELVELSEEI